jgi:hypothetical protein
MEKKGRGRPKVKAEENNVETNEPSFSENETVSEYDNDIPSGNSNDIPDYNPLENPVIEREYTSGLQGQQADFNPNDVSDVIGEPVYIASADNLSDGEIEEETSGGGGQKFQANPDLQDMSASQKRKAAEETANALILTYSKFVPVQFKKWASFDQFKIDKLEMEGKIDLEMELSNDITIGEYIKGTNSEVEKIFTVTNEQKEEIKNPLVDVLLENNMALTPAQRLMMAVGGHILQMGASAFHLARQNKEALNTFQMFQQQKQNANNRQEPSRRSEDEKEVKQKPKAAKKDDDVLTVDDVIIADVEDIGDRDF